MENLGLTIKPHRAGTAPNRKKPREDSRNGGAYTNFQPLRSWVRPFFAPHARCNPVQGPFTNTVTYQAQGGQAYCGRHSPNLTVFAFADGEL